MISGNLRFGKESQTNLLPCQDTTPFPVLRPIPVLVLLVLLVAVFVSVLRLGLASTTT
jgi:hypothetical protein